MPRRKKQPTRNNKLETKRKIITKKKRDKVTKSLRQTQDMPIIKASRLLHMIRSVSWAESYTSLLMGIVAVVVGVLFVVSFVKQTHHIQQTSSTSTVANVTPTPESLLKPAEKTYTVKPGDDLWHIAEIEYKSGYNWVDIAKANNLADPSTIYAGNQLVIPSVTPKIATLSTSGQVIITTTVVPQEKAITSVSYTVQKGDDLWTIAIRAYGDGNQWAKIAQANNLSNPSLIFSGNILKIPR